MRRDTSAHSARPRKIVRMYTTLPWNFFCKNSCIMEKTEIALMGYCLFSFKKFSFCFHAFHQNKADNMKVKNDHRSKFRGGHGFESRWSPDFFRLLLSNCLNWKTFCDDRFSLSGTNAVHMWIISYMLHAKDENNSISFLNWYAEENFVMNHQYYWSDSCPLELWCS